jgi:hypothetical protein
MERDPFRRCHYTGDLARQQAPNGPMGAPVRGIAISNANIRKETPSGGSGLNNRVINGPPGCPYVVPGGLGAKEFQTMECLVYP